MIMDEGFVWELAGLYSGIIEKNYGPFIVLPNSIYFISLSQILTSSKSKAKLVFESFGRSSSIALAKRQTDAKNIAREKLDNFGEISGKLENLVLEFENSIKIDKHEIIKCKSKGFGNRLFTIKTENKSFTFDLLEPYTNNIAGISDSIEKPRKEIIKDFFHYLYINNYPFENKVK